MVYKLKNVVTVSALGVIKTTINLTSKLKLKLYIYICMIFLIFIEKWGLVGGCEDCGLVNSHSERARENLDLDGYVDMGHVLA